MITVQPLVPDQCNHQTGLYLSTHIERPMIICSCDESDCAAVQAGCFMFVGDQMGSHLRADATILSGLAIVLQGASPLQQMYWHQTNA